MRNTINVATASINTIPLDIKHNVSLILKAYKDAIAKGADIVLTPELAITGYGLEDMFYVSSSMSKIPKIIKDITKELDEHKYLAVGFPLLLEGGQLYNAVALLTKDNILGIVVKQNLARTGIHYEPRWFTPWQHGSVITLNFAGSDVKVGDLVFVIDGVRIGFEICEDSWVANRPGRSLCRRLCDIILNPSASHFALGKEEEREMFITEGSRTFGVIYVYTNLLGCEAGRAIYDGQMLIASGGKIVARSNTLSFKEYNVMTANCDLRVNRNVRAQSSMLLNMHDAFEEGVCFTKLSFARENLAIPLAQSLSASPENPYKQSTKAVALGLWDWMRKTHTSGFALSLSGGADSALCLTCVFYAQLEALASLGLDDYLKVLQSSNIIISKDARDNALKDPLNFIRNDVMPKVMITLYQGSEYSGSVTFNAAKDLAAATGASHHSWSIASLVKEYIRLADSLTPDNPLSWEKDDLALQNIQARVRAPGIWLLANKFNKLLLATSNLSEASVGYCTMDGDTSGVLSPIGGIGKSLVLKINEYIMQNGLILEENQVFTQNVIPLPAMAGIVAQAPTAELRPVEQTDEKDLMPYPLLDEIRSITQNMHYTPKEVFIELLRGRFALNFSKQFILDALRRYYHLYCRNQWKRERIACSFHIERDSADPKTFRRFPVLSSALAEEMQELNEYAKELGLE